MSPIRVVVDVRDVVYPARPRVNLVSVKVLGGRSRWRQIDFPGGTGWEIVREQVICPACDDRS